MKLYDVKFYFGVYEWDLKPGMQPTTIVRVEVEDHFEKNDIIAEALEHVGRYPKTYTAIIEQVTKFFEEEFGETIAKYETDVDPIDNGKLIVTTNWDTVEATKEYYRDYDFPIFIEMINNEYSEMIGQLSLKQAKELRDFLSNLIDRLEE